MRTRAVCFVMLIAGLLPAQAPSGPVIAGRLAVVVANGRVHVYPSRVPSEGEGWIIRRDGVALTPEPLTGVRGPAAFEAAIGSDMSLIQRITATDNALAAYRRLRVGGSASGIAQVLSPRAAAALGAMFVDSTARAGATHAYTAELVRLSKPDSVLRRAVASVRVANMVVASPPQPTAQASEGTITVAWDAPRFTGAAEDIVVAYTVERADSAGPFERITPLPVMRLADKPSGHRDDEVTPGKLYRYRVRAGDLLGRLSEPGPAVAIRAPATRGPLPPAVVAADVADGKVRVVWTVSPEPRTRGYHVERSVGGDSSYARITRRLVPGDVPEFSDSLVRGLEVYSYRVRAVDDMGRVGAPSNPTTVRALDQRAPVAPTALTVTPLGGHRVRVSWRAVPDGDVRGYDVQRAEPGDTGFARLTRIPIRAVTYVDSGYSGNTLEPGREYAWRVVAVDSSGNTSPAAEVRYRIADDEAPDPVRSILVHNQMGRRVDITWTGSPSIGVAHYLVERVTGATPPVLIAKVGTRDAFVARDTTPVKGRTSQWRVVAVDSVGNRSAPASDTLTFRDLTRPPAPRRATAVRTAGVTTVRWERVVSVDLRGYVVYRADRSDGPRTKLTATPLTVLEFIDRGATAGARYVVRAVDASGNESAESPVAVVVQRP